jgi:hypothetical protein
MRTKIFLMAAIVAATVMTSCGNNEDEMNNGADRVAVKFQSTGVDVAQTRVTGNAWNAGDSIGIYMVDHSTTDIAEGAENIQYKANAGGTGQIGFTAASTVIYYPVPGSVDFIAYHPYQSTLTNWIYKVDVSSGKQASQTGIDLLWGKAGTGYTKTTSSVNIPFTHRLAKLHLTVQAGAGVPALPGLTVAINGLHTTADFDVKTGGALTNVGTTAVITPRYAGSYQFEAILIPENITSQTVSFSTGGNTYTWRISDNIGKFEAGKRYNYTVTLRKTGLIVTGNIADWETAGTGTGTGIAE